ncbi:MAG: HAMP domain-containing histidine kinase [Nitrospirae bacterium]|nr:HAMP domain-containing histidine kinase [Nitrospirota bacterium]
MSKLTDSELIAELKNRFEEQGRALHDLMVMTRKLEDVNSKLQESETMKSHFISNIKNEINNPLSVILAMSETMSGLQSYAVEEIASMGELIFTEAFTLDFQLKNIFAAAEIEAGEASPYISNVDIDSLLRGLVDVYKKRTLSKKLTISFEWIGDVVKNSFKTDSEKLELILSNLISNAIEYTSEGGKVAVKAWRHDNSLNIIVEDTGIGIGEDDKQVIFERFKQLEEGVRKRHKGHGLGLSVTKALVELLGGTISVVSIKDRGSIFTVFIPEISGKEGIDVFSDDGNEFFFEEETKF